MKAHWYFTTIYECPVCFHRREVRERRYGYRPKNYRKRVTVVFDYDYCDMGDRNG